MHEIADPIACPQCPLQACPGLRELGEQQLVYMEEFKDGEVALERGDALIEEGECHERLYTVLDGVLIRSRSLDDGRRQIVNFMFPGDLIGLHQLEVAPMALEHRPLFLSLQAHRLHLVAVAKGLILLEERA